MKMKTKLLSVILSASLVMSMAAPVMADTVNETENDVIIESVSENAEEITEAEETVEAEEIAETDEAVETEEQCGDGEVTVTELAPSTTITLFKPVSASIETTEEETVLVMALNGSGYKELFIGTYEEAVANVDGSCDLGNDSWIHGSLNEAGKYEFRIPVGEDDLDGALIPVVAVSASKYQAYLNGMSELVKAFYPRQIQIDMEACTLVAGDLNMHSVLNVTNNSNGFDLTAAELNTVSGPNSNDYAENLIIIGTTYTKAYIGTKEEAQTAESVIEAVDGTITLNVRANSTGGIAVTDYLDQPVKVSTFNEEDNCWNEYLLTVSKTERNLKIENVSHSGEYTIQVTASVQAEGAYVLAPQALQVNGALAESYGYIDTILTGVSTLDVLVAETQLIFGDDYTEETKDGYLAISEEGWITTILGEDTSASSFRVNDEMLTTLINATAVEDGDCIVCYLYTDRVYYTDRYTFLSVENEDKVHFGIAFTVSLQFEGYDSNWNTLLLPDEGAQIGILEDGVVTEIDGVVTDEDGKVQITFAEPGDYTLTAYGTDDTDSQLIMNPLTVHVAGHTEVTDNAVDATCTEAGLTEGKHCSVCKETLVAQEEIAALGHSFTKYVSNKDATYVADGTKTAACDHDGCEVTRTVTDTGSKKAKKSLSGCTVSLSFTSEVYTGAALEPTVVVKNGTKTVSSKYYTVSYTNNTNPGTATVKVTAKSGNYPYSGSNTATFKITAKSISISSLTNAAGGITVKWPKVTGASGYYIYRGSTKIKDITSGTTVNYTDTKATTNGTKYTYKVVAYKTVSGKKVTFAKSGAKYIYRLSRPAISTLTNSAAKTMKATWSKNAKATGYQIQYSTSRSFSSPKTVTVTKYTTVSKTIGSLTKGKTYYVRVRSYKTVSGVKYYSAWSDAKSVKISK